MEKIGFSNNKLKHIDDGAFRGLEKLNYLELHLGNPCINKLASTRSTVIALISEAELKCKNANVMTKRREEPKLLFKELNEKLSRQISTIEAQLTAMKAASQAQLDEMKETKAQIEKLNEHLLQQNATIQEMSYKLLQCRLP